MLKKAVRHYKLDTFPFKSTTTSCHEFLFFTPEDFTKSLLVNIGLDKLGRAGHRRVDEYRSTQTIMRDLKP
jgi:hypothetical protein